MKISILHKTTYETEFISGFEKGNIFGVQYHPEKSHQQGMEMMKRFLEVGRWGVKG
jgi:glutamine amidotransferase